MTASLIDGKWVAEKIKQTIAATVLERITKGQKAPGLAVILVGSDPASSIYVKHKRKACHDVGIASYAYDLPPNTDEKELLRLIDSLNNNSDIHGILVQLPLPEHINTRTVIEHIAPQKDVDGFHPYNLGRLAQGAPRLRPCTPYGVMQLLSHYQYDVQGKHAVVIGASNIVGRPMALELLLAKATPTICHSATTSLEQYVRLADIVIIATGKYNVVPANWLQKRQIIIDIGMHRDPDGTLHGDVNFNEAKKNVQAITPGPGGVGPMTVATLLQNTLLAATGY